MRTLIIGAVAVVVAMASMASAAGTKAPPPKPVDPTIVPGVSLGGVAVNQPISDADFAWGGKGDCKSEGGVADCDYGGDLGKVGYATILSMKDDLVTNASISAGKTKNGAVRAFGTKKGNLGIGDKLKQVAKRYPGGKLKNFILTYTEGDTVMTFLAGGKDRETITAITIGPS